MTWEELSGAGNPRGGEPEGGDPRGSFRKPKTGQSIKRKFGNGKGVDRRK